jgi:hypothetical protein
MINLLLDNGNFSMPVVPKEAGYPFNISCFTIYRVPIEA